ncbi:MAG: carbohydrate porin [Planctomycetota bacterium]|jgi:porin
MVIAKNGAAVVLVPALALLAGAAPGRAEEQWTLPTGRVAARSELDTPHQPGTSELPGDARDEVRLEDDPLDDDFVLDLSGARARFGERGGMFDLVYTAEGFANTRGGLNTDGAHEYRGDLSLTVEMDTATAEWWEGGSFFLHVQSQHGNSLTNEHIGDFQVVSNIDADDFTQVSEFWYRHSFADDRFWVKIGKQDATAEFAAPEYGGEFISSSPGFAPTIPMLTFPDPDLGFAMGVRPREEFSLSVGAYQGRPDADRSFGQALDALSVPLVLVEPAFHYAINGSPGHLRIGYWLHADRAERFDGTGDEERSQGWYVTWDQQLSTGPGGEEGQGLGCFAQYGWAPADRSEAASYVGGGIQWVGPSPSRGDDVLGFGIFSVRFSDEAGFAETSETIMELFYKLQLTESISAKLDTQYIANPGGTSNDGALATGIRVEVSF